MQKELALRLLILLSALESWSFSTSKPLPEHVYNNLTDAIDAAMKGGA